MKDHSTPQIPDDVVREELARINAAVADFKDWLHYRKGNSVEAARALRKLAELGLK